MYSYLTLSTLANLELNDGAHPQRYAHAATGIVEAPSAIQQTARGQARTQGCGKGDRKRRTMKTRVTQRRIRAPKHSACVLCKPQKRGWEDKRTPRDRRLAVGADEQLKAQRL